MYTYWKFLSQRYLSQKGQGIVEYAVIVAVVIAVGVVLAGDTAFSTSVKTLYEGLATKAAKVGA